jgi:xylan 1,4-beta-xylosidase
VQKIKECYAEIKRPSIGHVEQLGYIYVILGIIMEKVFLEPSQDNSDPALSSKILFYINDNFKNGITPSQIAAHFGYSQSYISRYFKSCFNITLIKYLTIIKLQNAITLMREGKHSATYCSLESGFSSMRTFYRAFYNEFGCSPGEFLGKKNDE